MKKNVIAKNYKVDYAHFRISSTLITNYIHFNTDDVECKLYF